jgi:hypothetical protein
MMHERWTRNAIEENRMQNPSSKSREHRMRVLENQEKRAAERNGSGERTHDPQMEIPLIVEVKGTGTSKRPRMLRPRRKSQANEPELGDL